MGQVARGVDAKLKKCRASLSDLAIFSRQFAAMLTAGVPVHRALTFFAQEPGRLQPIIEHLANAVASGLMLSSALRLHPHIFSPVIVGQVEAGEASGRLDRSWDRLARMLEREVSQQKRVQAALTYPVILLLFSSVVILGLIYVIVPVILPLFQSLKVPLPWPTRVLMTLRIVLIPVVVPAAALALTLALARHQFLDWFRAQKSLKLRWDRLLLNLPVVGGVLQKLIAARVLYCLSTLLENGLTLVAALNKVATVAGNDVMAERIRASCRSLIDGATFRESLASNQVLPAAAIHLLAAGEECATLGVITQRVADFYDEEVTHSLEVATALLEPVIMAVMGCIIGFIAIASVLPTLQLLSRF